MKKIYLVTMLTWVALALNVQTVYANCTVSTTPVAFGNYNPFSGSNLDSTGTTTVSCSLMGCSYMVCDYYYVISLSPGAGNHAQRKMSGPSSWMNYNLFTDAARASIWGDGNGGTTTKGGTITCVKQNGGSCTGPDTHTVYGRIPGSQTSLYAGSHSDTITVTVNY